MQIVQVLLLMLYVNHFRQVNIAIIAGVLDYQFLPAIFTLLTHSNVFLKIVCGNNGGQTCINIPSDVQQCVTNMVCNDKARSEFDSCCHYYAG